MAIVKNGNISEKLCEIFGLNPEEVTSIEFQIIPNEIVYVTVGRVMYVDEMKKVMEVLKEYDLVRNDKTSEITGNEDFEIMKKEGGQ